MAFIILFWIYVLFFAGVTNILNWEVWGLPIAALIVSILLGKTFGIIDSGYAFMIAIRKLVLSISQKFSDS